MVILHVDMDAFFASVEQRDHPEWRGKPVIVGSGANERGVVSTCSYEARKFGVHSAMPSRTAFALCPDGIFVRPRMKAYEETSRRAFEIFSRYSPYVEGVSVDEAFMDVSGTVHLFGDMVQLAEKLRFDICKECGITCSVGIAPNRLLAKIASEQRKPNGLFIMPFDEAEIRAFLAPKPVGVLWGVGKKTADVLIRKGFHTCGDLQRADSRFLSMLLGESAAESIRRHAFGIDDTPVAYEEQQEKSVSRETTFPIDESNRETVRRALLELVEDVGRRFRATGLRAKTAKLKLRDGAFNTITRQASFEVPARDDISMRHLALSLFDAEWLPNTQRIVRLIGFGVTNFTDSPPSVQKDLFGEAPDVGKQLRLERLSETLDAIRSDQFRTRADRARSTSGTASNSAQV